MSEELEFEIPKQPAGELPKVRAFWVAFGVLSTATMLVDSPYDLRAQSTTMVKGEVVTRIRSSRETYQGWPVDQTDLRFGHGDLAKAEVEPPKFRIVNLTHDKNDPSIEFASYSFDLRGTTQTIKIRYNPSEKPKRKLF